MERQLSSITSYMIRVVLPGGFRNLGVPYFGVLIIRILLFGVLHWSPIFSETLKV